MFVSCDFQAGLGGRSVPCAVKMGHLILLSFILVAILLPFYPVYSFHITSLRRPSSKVSRRWGPVIMSGVKAPPPTGNDIWTVPKGEKTFRVLDALANEDSSGGAGSSISREGLLRMDVSIVV